MQALQRVLPKLLVVAAAGVILAALLSDHSAEFGKVTLPQGGVVTLPEGTTKVFVEEGAQSNSDSSDPRRLSAPLRFHVIPVGGGPALANDATTSDGTNELQTTRSQAVGSGGAVASLDVPSEGDYRVTGSLGRTSGTSLSFGSDAFMAVLDEWKLLAGLLAAAFLISTIPLPKRDSSYDSTDGTTTSTYQPPRFNPYRG